MILQSSSLVLSAIHLEQTNQVAITTGKKIVKIITPIKLKMTCTSAARFAAIEPAKLAKIAVIVVPMLSPSNTGDCCV